MLENRLRPQHDPALGNQVIALGMHFTTETLHETAGWTPYAGLTLQGWPQATLSRGKIVVQDGEFVGGMGNGRFLHRTQANL